MINVILVIHLILAIALVGLVLLQRSEGGALGIGGGGGGGMSGFMTGRGTANLLTRATAILAALFLVTSLALAKLAGMERGAASILDTAPLPTQEAPIIPEPPAGPSAPIAR
jgi:preprotein translocase subunit SecG